MNDMPQIEFLQKELSHLRLPMETSVNPNTGNSTISVPIPISSGRQDFTPQLALSYASSSSNTSYGSGWNLSGLSAISIDTKNGFPKYNDEDKFALDGTQLVPYLKQNENWVESNGNYTIHYFRMRWEKSFQRIEFWKHSDDLKSYWVVRNPDNTISVYGKDNSTRLSDPENKEHIFSWLLQEQYDQNGNIILYTYKEENTENIDATSIFEHNRFKARNPLSQRYLKCIKYGNDKAVFFGDDITSLEYHFKILLDYGEHDENPEDVYKESTPWLARKDPFSSYGTGFEIRTWRLCQRILMFHHFPNNIGEHVLIGETKLHHQRYENGAILNHIGYTSYKIEHGEYWKEHIPKLTFHYQAPVIGESFAQAVENIGFENMPYGFGDGNYKMIDLYGEGVSGILFETEKTWYFKANLGNGNFGNMHQVAEKPVNHIGGFAISDFDNNGNPNLVALQGSKAGFYEYDRDQKQWSQFQTFTEAPSVEHGAQLMDINGDGKAELVVLKQDRLTYYPSKGKAGFAEAIELSRPIDNGVSHLPTLGDNLMLDYFSADMTGDGMPDQVRVLNGRVEYWSHLGHGRYTEGTVMANAPILEEGFEFDASRIRLVDLTGSGTSDLLYIGRGEIRYWINASGNQFLKGNVISGIPYIDNFASVQIADFLGNGTACLVWSSALPIHSHSPLQYLQLVGTQPPGLLVKVENGMGMETTWKYTYSAKHYLQDKREGNPWLTHLPSHSYIVEQETVEDKIAQTKLSTEYKYHDGFYDGEEREFRGFSYVEQFDIASMYDSEIDLDLLTAEKACIKTWFHNGALGWREQRQQQHYQKGQTAFELPNHTIENIDDLSANGFTDAFKTLAGQVLRTEVYGYNDKGLPNEVPYQISQNNYVIRELQPKKTDENGCYISFAKEELVCNYEKKATNPLVNHSLNLEYNNYGIVTKQCTIGYPNMEADDTINEQPNPQKRLLCQYTEQKVTSFNETDRYELGIPLESKAFEIDGNKIQRLGTLFSVEDIQNAVFTNQLKDANLRTWQRSFYTDINTSQAQALPFGSVSTKALLHHQEVMIGKLELFDTVFNSKADAELLLNQGNYVFSEEHYWQKSETILYQPKTLFFLPNQIKDANAIMGTTTLTFDAYQLQLQKITDSLGFNTTAEIDYHTLAPYKITDSNANVSEVLYDPLGMIRVSTVHGQIRLDNANVMPQPYGNEALSSYDAARLQATDIADCIANPTTYLQEASSYYGYDLFAWENDKKPLQSLSLLREQFLHNGKGNVSQDSQIQLLINYTDGFGRDLQTLQKVETGDAIKVINGEPQFNNGNPILEFTDNRWLVSGHVIYNKKQEPIKQYEPFFYSEYGFTNHKKLQQFGYATEIEYDALGRTVKTNFPNGTYSKVEIKAWEIRQFDANDTILENTFYELTTFDEHEQKAIEKAKAHANTPTIIHLDALGREVIVEEVGLDDNRISITEFDFYGNPIKIIDPRKIEAFTYVYDKAGHLLYEKSVDAGEKWTFQNTANLSLHFWDGRGLHQSFIYDDYDRPIKVIADGITGYNKKVVEHIRYGDKHANQNANGLPIEHYDQAGKQTFLVYDPSGTPLRIERQLTKDFKTEPDWEVLNQSLLEDEKFTTKIIVDALGRPIQEDLADKTTRLYSYHLSGGLQSLKVSTADGLWQDKEILKNTAYNAKGQREIMFYGNDIRTKHSYDHRTFQLKRLHSSVVQSGNIKNIQDLSYTHDPVGNITRIANAVKPLENSTLDFTKDYTYDAHYQLTQVNGLMHQALFDPSAGSQTQKDHFKIYQKGRQHIALNNTQLIEKYTRTYTYDASGNRIQMKHTCASGIINSEKTIDTQSNRSILSKNLGGSSIVSFFDANGNRLSLKHLQELQWNYRNNIASATSIVRPNGNADAEYYNYGSDGLRVRKVNESYGNQNTTITTIETIYLYGCEVKRTKQGSTIKEERWLSHFKDGDTVLARAYFWEIGGTSTSMGEHKLHYILSDHLGSVSIETNEQAACVSFEEYFPFGGTGFSLSINQNDIKQNEYRYSGKERDDLTGLYYYGYRYYTPWLGNWINPDPIGPEDGLNLYRFVWNNPISFKDSHGLQTVKDEIIGSVDRFSENETEYKFFTEKDKDNIDLNSTEYRIGSNSRVPQKSYNHKNKSNSSDMAISEDELMKLLGPDERTTDPLKGMDLPTEDSSNGKVKEIIKSKKNGDSSRRDISKGETVNNTHVQGNDVGSESGGNGVLDSENTRLENSPLQANSSDPEPDFGELYKEYWKGVLNGGYHLVTHPLETLEGMIEGVDKTVKAIGEGLGSAYLLTFGDESQKRYARSTRTMGDIIAESVGAIYLKQFGDKFQKKFAQSDLDKITEKIIQIDQKEAMEQIGEFVGEQAAFAAGAGAVAKGAKALASAKSAKNLSEIAKFSATKAVGSVVGTTKKIGAAVKTSKFGLRTRALRRLRTLNKKGLKPGKGIPSWGQHFIYKKGGYMSAIQHITYIHKFGSPFIGKSKFLLGLRARDIVKMVEDALRFGIEVENGFEYSFGKGNYIGTDLNGLKTSSIRVLVTKDGKIGSAFPIPD